MHKHRHERSIRPGSDGVEFDPQDPRIPVAFRIWRDGVNNSDKGQVKFTDRSREEVFRRFAERGMTLKFDYEHESSVPVEARPAPAVSGYGEASAYSGTPALRGKDLWVESVKWTDDAKNQIRGKKRTQVSPYFVTVDDGEIVELISVGLCFEGATHKGVDFAAAWRRRHARSNGMDMMSMIAGMQAILEKIQSGGGTIDEALAHLETMKSVAEALSGGGESAEAMGSMTEEQKMGGDYMKMAADVDEMKQAMGRMERTIAALVTSKAAPQAHARQPQVGASELAQRQILCDHIALANPGVVPADTVKHYRARGDYVGLQHVIGCVQRDRQVHNRGTGDIRPPKDNGVDPASDATEADRAEAARHGIPIEQFMATKRQVVAANAVKRGIGRK